MSKLVPLTIDNILNGWSPTTYLTGSGQFQSSLGIDPELPLTDSGVRPSGVLRPSALATFSSTEVNNHPVAIIITPKTTKIYVILANGKLLQYDADFTNGTLLGTASGNVAEGGFYQNDYIYIITGTDVSRYGKLSGTPSLTDNVWTGATLGTQTALVSSTYPSLLGTGNYPKHFVFQHSDDKGYLLDYKNDQGLVHFIKTDKDGNNSSSTYNALDLPLGMLPTCGSSYGVDIAVGAVKTTASTVNQGRSVVYFWDTVDTSFYRELPIPGVLTALFQKAGVLFAWAGSISGKGGHTLYAYDGSLAFKPVRTSPEGFPPPAYAVDAIGDRLVWGSFMTEPTAACTVLSYGSKDGSMQMGIQSIYKSNLTHTTTDGMITALKWAVQGTFAQPSLVIGGKNQTASQYILEKPGTTYGTSIFRSKVFNIGTNFTVKEIKFPLGVTLAANMTIVPKLYIDDESKTSTCTTVNSTNYADSNTNRLIRTYPSANAQGQNNFYLELTWSGTVLCPVMLPIVIILEIHD